ncbi:MAG: hypothetical protein M3P44_17620 [Actinomycetota bacterium]|nr:hypothetical protein [Actinomycetota bacterium]
MRRTSLLAGAGAALAMTLGAAPGALAADAVFGGSTTDGEAIVLTADKAAKKLRSAVIAWSAKCGDGKYLPWATEVTPASASPGFSPAGRDLLMSRNRKGRFAGKQVLGLNFGELSAAVKVTMDGQLRAKGASGTLSAQATIIDSTTGTIQTTCRTGRLRWKASRAPGHIYGGRTSQDEPIVAKLDARRKRVTDVLVSWSSPCSPEGSLRFSEALRNFPAASTGRFGNTWDETFKVVPDGGSRRFDYSLTGKLGRRSARGTFRVAVAETDAAGATRATCDTGGITWKATTG